MTFILTLLIYSKFLFFGHISWDDPEMVFKNRFVEEFDIKALISNHFVGNYIPVTMLTHALGWQLFGDQNGGHHAIQICLHLLNGVLVYRLGKKLFAVEAYALLGAVVFLLHPIQIESVGWISELKNVLSTGFYLAALLAYLNFREKNRQGYLLLCFFYFLMGCLSKSSVVVFPLVLILTDLYVDKLFTPKRLWNKIPFIVVSVCIGILNIKSQSADLFINHAHEFPIYQRVGFAGFALLKYLLLFLFPLNLSVIYPYPEAKQAVFILGFMILAGLVFLMYWAYKHKNEKLTYFILFVLLNLVLVLQFLPFGEVLYADRYMYVPVIGFGWVLAHLVLRVKLSEKLVVYVLIVLLSVFSFTRISMWKSALSLYEDIIKKYPTQFIALNSAGVESMFMNDNEKALSYFNRATLAAPRNYKGFYNRGLLYLKLRNPDQAIFSFNESLALYSYGKAYTGRAAAYYLKGDIPKAMNDARLALKEDATNARAHFVLGNCFNDLNKADEAIQEYNKSIQLNGDEADYYFKRAIALGKKQDFKSSLNDLTVCTHLNANYYEAYYWKGVVKVNLQLDPCEDLKIAAEHNVEQAIGAYHKYCK